MDNNSNTQPEGGMTVIFYAMTNQEQTMLNEMVEKGDAKNINDAIQKKIYETFIASDSSVNIG